MCVCVYTYMYIHIYIYTPPHPFLVGGRRGCAGSGRGESGAFALQSCDRPPRCCPMRTIRGRPGDNGKYMYITLFQKQTCALRGIIGVRVNPSVGRTSFLEQRIWIWIWVWAWI